MGTRKGVKLGLVPRLLLGIAIGLGLGLFIPESVVRLFVTISTIFSSYLGFVIPLMIVTFVACGIAHLSSGGAGRLLGATVLVAYVSTLCAGIMAYVVDSAIFPTFITSDIVENVSKAGEIKIEPFFDFSLTPVFDVTTAVLLAFILGIGVIALKTNNQQDLGDLLTQILDGLQEIIVFVLNKTIIPLLPFYIACIFAKLSFTGEVWDVMRVFWKVYVVIFCLHFIYMGILFCLAGAASKSNPFTYMKNQIPGWLTAVGTQSSAATIPVNLDCAFKNKVSKSIAEFVVPLCATIHLAGSTITIVSCGTAVLYMNNMPHGLHTLVPFIMTLGVVMIAAPGAPGGAIMSALPFLPMIGIPVEGQLASLMIALYLTQDSFGTACNVSGDNALAIIIDSFKEKITGRKVQTDWEK